MTDEPVKPRRHQSQTERDFAGIAARRDRARALPHGVPLPVFEEDDLTGQYEGEDLERARARRPTHKRIGHIEKKQDGLVKVVGDLRADVSHINGKLDILPQLLKLLEGRNTTEHETQRHGMTTRAKVITTIVGAVAAALGALIASGAGCA